jgi:hypothetical protein
MEQVFHWMVSGKNSVQPSLFLPHLIFEFVYCAQTKNCVAQNTRGFLLERSQFAAEK